MSTVAAPINCEWGSWDVGKCSTSCGGGTSVKTRSKKVKEVNGGKCEGKNNEKEPCNTHSCTGKLVENFNLYHGKFNGI